MSTYKTMPKPTSKRRRRHDSIDEGPLANWKFGIVIAVVTLSFAVLYPSVIHPMISSLFLRGQKQSPVPNRPHPHGAGQRNRPDIHPGIRMGGVQPEYSSGSSKGAFVWLLPLYTIGVVTFLVYTLIKSKRRKKSRPVVFSNDSNSLDEEEDDDGESDNESNAFHGIGRKKLNGLQKRLKQTELIMEKVLMQLTMLSGKVDGASNTTQNDLISDYEIDSEARIAAEQETITDEHLNDLEAALSEFKKLSSEYAAEEERGQMKRKIVENTSDEDNSCDSADVTTDNTDADQ